MSKKTPTATAPAKRGRPVIANSARQTKLSKWEAKLANGETISRGRPSNPVSNRQMRLATQAVRKSAGLDIKVGRPKKESTLIVEMAS